MVMINWLIQLAVLKNVFTIFSKSKVVLSAPSLHCLMIMRLSLGNTGEGTHTVYTLDLLVDLHSLKIWCYHIIRSGYGVSHD